MSRTLVITVGGTTEPIVKSIETHKPDFVCFLLSQGSMDKIGEIKNQLKEKNVTFQDYKVVIDDANDLIQCYEKARECVIYIQSKNVNPEDVIVDYTGGTKNMSLAIGLATIEQGYKFSYIGGEQRTKDGLGVVVTGTEKVITGVSPYSLFAIEEKKKITLYFNSYRFLSVIDIINGLLSRDIPHQQKRLFSILKEIANGYALWERFEHSEAKKTLKEGLNKLEEYCELIPDKDIIDFCSQCKKNLEFLNELQNESKGFKDICYKMVIDLIANASRRGVEEKYDDAVARLYRAVEMIGQIEFINTLKCTTSDVPVEKIPEKLKDEYITRYTDNKDSKIKFGLFPTYRVLNEIGNNTGQMFWKRQEEFLKLLNARNNSILAHGITPIGKSIYEKFFGFINEVFNVTNLPEFPKLAL